MKKPSHESADGEKILADLNKAVTLLGEAQNAYDFGALAQASEMRAEASALLHEVFSRSALLRTSFPVEWFLLQRGDEDCGFFYSQLDRARGLFADET